MARVKFTRHLVRFFPKLAENPNAVQAEGDTVAELIADLDEQFPGLAAYIVDERGALRKHVNIFREGELIRDRETLADAVQPDDQIHIFQALSGG